MQFVFIGMDGKTLFIRDDAERAQWTQEEMTLDMDFPFLPDKIISIGQRIFFKDPATGAHQIYEVKQAKTFQLDAYQQVTAENICVSELSDEHIDNLELTDETASNALATILADTLWSVGNVSFNPVSSVDVSRGSKWQAILEIKDNWNCYIEPRTVLNSDGSISRYLDITNTNGVWNGLRLSIDKNLLDPSVTFDDSEVATALYGYGGTVEDPIDPDVSTEITFADVVWAAEDGHPAKPYGQLYLEDPAATAEYGRDGRARFGFFQNSDITDPETLLEKTWETLQTTSTPAISIEGSVEDLYRMGYADQPLKLHDIALVEILPSGFKKQIQIIRMTVDLLDPTATSLTIGDYIPNIIYINRQTDENATGSRGGGGGNKAKDTNTWQEFKTTIEAYQDGTGMRIKSVQNDNTRQDEELAVQKAEIEVTYSMIRMEVQDRRDADNALGSRITQTASQIRAEVYATSSDIYKNIGSSITQTASQIRAEVWANASTTYSFIEQTATQIRSEVRNVNSAVYSAITQTASQIRSEVNSLSSGVYSSITQTASQIRSEVNASSSTLYSAITQTATQIRSEVASTASGLSSSITQNADKIAIVVNGDNTVNAASIVAGINNQNKESSSYVDINADYINLTGYVTATQLSAVSAEINNLATGATTATLLKATRVSATGLVLNSQTVSTYELKYKDHSGTNQTLTVLKV